MRYIVLVIGLVACGTSAPVQPGPEGVIVAPVEAVAPVDAKVDAAVVGASAAEEHFGSPFTRNEVLLAKDLLADPKAKVGQTVLVEGRVADVCQKAGCWMVITADEANGAMMRIRMKDHGFSVAKDASGTRAKVEGVVVEKPADPEEAAHFKSEAAKPEVQPEVAGQATYEIEAVAVSIQRGV